VDWEKLSSIFDQDLVDRISENPDEVISTLSESQQELVKDYARRQ
jgi:hypothetical protein